jgi:hypothetical protein
MAFSLVLVVVHSKWSPDEGIKIQVICAKWGRTGEMLEMQIFYGPLQP